MTRKLDGERGPGARACQRLLLGLLALELVGQPAGAVTFSTMTGAPVQMQPYVGEPGAPMVTVPAGTAQPFSGVDGSAAGSASGADGSSASGGSDALNTLLSQSSGSTIVANAESIGVNGSAVAATCVLESGCQALSGGSGAQGMFQMYPAAFNEGLQTALAANPSLASQIVQGPGGVNDPVTAGIAASGYLLQANTYLQNAGITNPTVLDVRSYYNFGPAAGGQIAQASDGDLMSQYVSPSVLAQNGASGSTTVAEWRAAVSAKIGNAATQTVSL